MDNAQWVKQALDSFERPLLRYATRLLGNAERAKDVVQETFLQLCQADRSRVENHLAAWLFRVCRNRALDWRRKEKRVQPLPTEQQDKIESRAPGPSAVLEKRQNATRVTALIATLPESQQEVVHLRFAGGLSYKQISEVTGHSVSNVGVLLHTAIKTVRQKLVDANGSHAAVAVAEGAK